MIRVRDLTLRAGERMLAESIAFDVFSGEVLAVLGPNGAGKTTLLRTLAGILAPIGSVSVDGVEVAAMHPAFRARCIAHVAADEVFLDQLTVRDVVSMGRYAHHRWWQWREEAGDSAAITAALGALNIVDLSLRRIDTLSSGERQRVWIALALAQEARVLLLDEPTSHLDLRVARDILHLLKAQAGAGKAIVCALHDINEAAEFADRVLLFGQGAILSVGKPQAVLTPQFLEKAYGVSVRQMQLPDGSFRVWPQ